MPRVPGYQGDRVPTRSLPAIRRQGPTADVYGAAVGEGLERVGLAVQSIYEEQQQRADQITLVDGKRRFNQLYQVQALGDDRGPTGARGLLTMQGMAPYEHLQANLEDWDAQADEIVKQAKTPRQQAILAGLRDQERARYTEQGQRHASAELEKYDVTTRAATRASAKDTAAAAAGTVGYEDIVANQIATQAAIVNSTPGLPPEAKARINAEDRSATHIGVLDAMLEQGSDLAAQAYWDRVTAPTAAFPQGEILPSQSAAIRHKLEINSTDGEGNRIATVLFERMGPQQTGDPINLTAMGKEARALATRGGAFDLKVYNRAMDYLKVRSAEWQASQKSLADSAAGPILEAVATGTPLVAVKAMPGWASLSGEDHAKIIGEYEARARRTLADARASVAEARQAHNWQRSLLNEPYEDLAREERMREFTGGATYYNLMYNPEMLVDMDGPALQQQVQDLSQQQQAQVRRLHQQVRGNVQASAVARADNDLLKDLAFSAGFTYVHNSRLTDEQKREQAALRSAIELELSARQQRAAGATGAKVTFSIAEQKDVIQEVLDRKVLAPGRWYQGMQPTVAAVVKQDQLGIVYVPWAEITDAAKREMRAVLRGVPTPGQVRALSDAEIDARYQAAMQRAAGIAAAVPGDEAWLAYLNEQAQAWRPPARPTPRQTPRPQDIPTVPVF